jgi:helicase MOV-10
VDASKLQEKKYAEFFRLLLHIEEHQMRIDIRTYDRVDQTMEIVEENKKLLSLKVQNMRLLSPTTFLFQHGYYSIKKSSFPCA